MTRISTRATAVALTALCATLIIGAPAGATTTQPPERPGAPTLTALTQTTATFTWAPPQVAPPDRYDVWRVNASDNGEYVNTVVGTGYTMAGLSPDTEYTVFVEPQGDSWLPSQRLTFRTMALPIDTEAPSRPGTPVVTAINGDTVSLTWAPATDNIGVHLYRIERILGGTARGIWSSTTDNATISMLDWDADYTVQVVAYDVNGNASPASGTVSFRARPDVGTTCRYQYSMSGPLRGTVRFTNTGHTLDGWTLRVTVTPAVPAAITSGAGYTIGDDVVLWHFRGGNYAMMVGRTEQVSYNLAVASISAIPPKVALNGHACTFG